MPPEGYEQRRHEQEQRRREANQPRGNATMDDRMRPSCSCGKPAVSGCYGDCEECGKRNDVLMF